MQIFDIRMSDFDIVQKMWNDTGNMAICRNRAIGYCAHQPHFTATINKTKATSGQHFASFSRNIAVNRIIAVGGTGKYAYFLHEGILLINGNYGMY